MSGSGKPPSKLGGHKSPAQNYRQSSGKQEVIQCRVCQKEMKFQNYMAHLKFQHPREDFKNLRAKGNKSILNMIESQHKQTIKRSGTDHSNSGGCSTKTRRVDDDNNQGEDNNNQSGDNNKQSGDNNNQSEDNNNGGGDNNNQSGDNNNQSGNNNNQSRDNNNQFSDNDEYSDDNQNDAPAELTVSPSKPAVDDGDTVAKHDRDNDLGLDQDDYHDSLAEVPRGTKEEEKTSIETLNIIVAKLAPLAQMEDGVINKLVDTIEKLSKLSLSTGNTAEKEKQTRSVDLDLNAIFFSCHSIADIGNKFQEFEYEDDLARFVCCVCKTQGQSFSFSYNCDEKDFTDKAQSKEFGNLKKSLKQHLQTFAHKKALEVVTNASEMEYKEDSRNKAVALKISRIAYFLLKSGRPDTDFTALIYLHSANGSDIGDINHSYRFPAQFLKHVSSVIEEHVKQFLSCRLVQTGHKPPLKIVADKATWQHQTRQLIGIVTVVPDSDEPLQAMILKTPVVKSHTGLGVTESITSVTDQFITADQFLGGAFDGQYFHLGVNKLLDGHYRVTAQYDVDPMHRAGTEDLKLRKEKSSTWIVSMTIIIGRAFKAVNYGKLFEHFFEVCEELTKLGYDVHFKFPRFYSETKFANYVRLVYGSFREDYPGLVRTFKEVVERLVNGSSEDRKRAKDIASIQGQIFNLKFVIELSGSCDIYNRFGHGINTLQKVNILPHIKYDEFISIVVDGLRQMADSVDPKDCPCDKTANSPRCLWPLLHKDLKEIFDRSTYRGVTIGNLMDSELSTRAGERRAKQNLLLGKADIIQKCLEKLALYSRTLGANLFAKVFQEKDKKLIEAIRVVLDLETLSLKLKLTGSAHVAAVQSKHFIQKSREIVPGIDDISDEEIRYQYRDFLRKLESYVEDKDEGEIFSMDIFRSFLNSDLKLFLNVEVIIHILAVAATSITVESIVESWVSIYESHSNKHRPISNERAEMEVSVAVNGPLLQHADSVLIMALRDMYKDAKDLQNRGIGRFVRRNNNIADYVVSKSVDAFKMKPKSKPFMC